MVFDLNRRFTALRKKFPELSDSQLLNSNNQSPFIGKADVVVAGAGILGLCYAIRLKTISPDLKIEVFEKNFAPTQKIGESTLSPFSTFTTDNVLPFAYLLRLFGVKDGLQFYCIDQEGKKVTANDLGGLDISFQLDRRMSELFLTMWAQSIGINVYHGVEVDFKIPEYGSVTSNVELDDDLTPPQVLLKDSTNTIGDRVDAKLVCDASGFSRRLTSKFGFREKLEGGWNCDAYWAYFKEKDTKKMDSRLISWDYPATKHICFPEGWGWFIGLISWHHAPLPNLMDMVSYFITTATTSKSPDNFPCTRTLSKMFDCPFEFITSIGWAVRNDFKLPSDLSAYGKGEAEQKFNFFKKRYPTLEGLMDGTYDLLPGYYDGRTYFVRKAMAYRSPIVAGNGWLAVGNTAGFTNPLISPGINAGICGSWRAAKLTHEVFAAPEGTRKQAMRKAAAAHQAFMHDFAYPRLNNLNRMWYNSFRDHRLFEALPRCIEATSIEDGDTHYYGDARKQFTESDSMWLLGVGLDPFWEMSQAVLKVLDGVNCGAPPCEDEVCRAMTITESWVKARVTKWPENKWGSWMRQYNDQLQKVPGKVEREEGRLVSATRCNECRYFVIDQMRTCPICGLKKDIEVIM